MYKAESDTRGHPVPPTFSHAVLYHLPFQALFQPYMFLKAIIWRRIAAVNFFMHLHIFRFLLFAHWYKRDKLTATF